MNIFSINRLALLMQKNIYENSKNFLKGLAIFFGILIVIILTSMTKDYAALKGLPAMFQGGFIILGVVVSGMAFSNFRTKEKSMSYLALPATTTEKLLAELLVSTLVYFVVYVLSFYTFNFLMILFGKGVGVDFTVEMVDIFSHNMLQTYHYFIIAQSILFVGAATFMKRPLLSTGFTLFVVGIIYLLYTILGAYMLKDSGFSNFNLSVGINDTLCIRHNGETTALPYYMSKLALTAKYLFKYALAPIFWFVAYLKLKEKEV